MSTGRSEKEQLRVHIRWMIRRDMPEVLQTEQQSFGFAWTEEDFLRCLRQRNCIGMVAEHDHRIIGFMIYELHKSKLRVLNFATIPDMRRQGVGAQMIRHAEAWLCALGVRKVQLLIRESNIGAAGFYDRQGYERSSVIVMQRWLLPPHSSEN